MPHPTSTPHFSLRLSASSVDTTYIRGATKTHSTPPLAKQSPVVRGGIVDLPQSNHLPSLPDGRATRAGARIRGEGVEKYCLLRGAKNN